MQTEPSNSGACNDGNKRFFKNIKIYSMHNHKFAEYTLINPIITSFNHDNHAYANGGLMQHSMSLAYETVKYASWICKRYRTYWIW